MKLLNLKKIAFASAWVFGGVFSLNSYATCTSTLENSSSISGTTFGTNANDQCLINSGTITGTGFLLNSYYSNPTITNNGSIEQTGAFTGAIVIPGLGGGGAISSSGSILNRGTISTSGAGDTYGIWLYNDAGVFNSVVNSGNINMANAGQSVGIFNYSGNTIATLTNSGTISVTGGYGAIANNSIVTTLNNSGSISSSGNAQGIVNNSGASIGTLNNTGTIYVPTSGYYGIVNSSGASIGTLNNSQGAISSAGALTYSGVLPTNYNIIISSASSYGQLSGTSVTGSTSFGIYSGSLITSRLYSSVLQGLTTSNVGATRTGAYDGMTWTLGLRSGSTTVWDLTFAGASTIGTRQSLELSAQRLKGIYNLQSTAVVNGLTYDCRLFDVNNICLSTGGRYSNNHGASGYTTSALLIGAYRLNKNIRLGAWVDQNLSTNTVTGINLSNSKPLFGVFGAWAENPSGEGYEVKVSVAYGDRDLTITRDVIGVSEAGFGGTKLNSQAISTVSSYGFKLKNDILVSPYVGVQYSRVASGGYTEASTADVTAPLTYGRLSQENVSILAGLKLSARLDPKTALFGSVGIEQNVNNKSGQYSAAGVDGLTAVDFNSNVQKTRATASAGVSYDIDKKQRVSLSGIYREAAFNTTATTSLFATYTVGL